MGLPRIFDPLPMCYSVRGLSLRSRRVTTRLHVFAALLVVSGATSTSPLHAQPAAPSVTGDWHGRLVVGPQSVR